MTGEQKHIEYLWQQFIAKKATPQELDELFLLLQGDENAEFSNLLEGQYAEPAKGEWDREYWLAKLDEIKKTPAISEPPTVPVRKMKPWRWIAAASAIFIITTASYFYFNQKTITNPEAHTKHTVDVAAPQTNRATITLATGQVIYLDSAESGTIAKEGKIELSKINEGQVKYKVSPTGGDLEGAGAAFNTLTNPRGSKVIDITLSDGSRIWLNAGSSLKYPVAFTGKERKVEINGEAYFEVTHDAAKPFIVGKNDMNVQVLGTHFDINAYDDNDDIKVTLLEGSVKVSASSSPSGGIENSGRSPGVRLKPGQQAILFSSGGPQGASRLTVHDNINTGEVTSWKDGLFHFESGDLKSILKEFSRWYDVDVVYEGSIPTDKFFVIIKRNSNLSSVLKALQAGGIDFNIEGKKLTVRSMKTN